jgi:Acetyltransferase (GNAT) domain
MQAELIADRGAAASGEDFFRSAEFLAAEGVTHTLRIGALATPLVVREVPGGEGLIDASSPYGYPGLAGPAGARVDPGAVDFAPTGLVSVFIRHRLGDPPLDGARERNVVQIADPTQPRKSRMSDRQQIRRNERRGYASEIAHGPEADDSRRAAFVSVYDQTMRRAGASERYLFGREYFDRILASEGAWLALVREPDGGVAAGSIAVESDGFLHYYLSGTADESLRDSPMKNLVATLVEFAWGRDLPLNLGGGIEPGDRLEEFKRGFANRRETWRTSEIVSDPEAYRRLSAGIEAEGFFPAYRSRSA